MVSRLSERIATLGIQMPGLTEMIDRHYGPGLDPEAFKRDYEDPAAFETNSAFIGAFQQTVMNIVETLRGGARMAKRAPGRRPRTEDVMMRFAAMEG